MAPSSGGYLTRKCRIHGVMMVHKSLPLEPGHPRGLNVSFPLTAAQTPFLHAKLKVLVLHFRAGAGGQAQLGYHVSPHSGSDSFFAREAQSPRFALSCFLPPKPQPLHA